MSNDPLEPEWRPRTRDEQLEAMGGALARLASVAHAAKTDVQSELIAAVQKVSMLLLDSALRLSVVDLIGAVRKAYPESREQLRRLVAQIIQDDKEHWKQLPPAELAELEDLHTSLEDYSLGARLQQQVSMAPWDRQEDPDYGSLASELRDSPDSIAEHWAWLTSGDAADGSALGDRLLQSMQKQGYLIKLPPFLQVAAICGSPVAMFVQCTASWATNGMPIGLQPNLTAALRILRWQWNFPGAATQLMLLHGRLPRHSDSIKSTQI